MANNETKVLKNNTLEQWRQKTNEVSYHLGDVDQLDNRLTDKVYTYSSTSESVFSVYDADASSKNLRFEIKQEEVIDAPATIIMTGNPTIPSSFVSDVVLFQGNSGSETFTGIINYINKNKISLKNTTGTFNASLPIKFSTDSIANTKLVRLVTESYKVGYVKAVQDGTTLSQSLTQSGFHVPNLSLRVVLSGSPSIPASFTEGATVTQSNGFSGVLYKATTSELLFKSHSGNFSVSANAGVPHTDASNRIAAANISSQAGPDLTLGNIIELHTIPTSDDVVITSTNTIDAIIEIQDDIGEITSLGTTNKSDIVSSINEIETAARGTNSNYTLTTTAQNFRDAIREHETDIGNMVFTGLSATDISTALRELRTELGNHASLGTTHTADAVGAINELETAIRGSAGNYAIGTNANDLVAAINEIETVLRAGNSDYTLTTSAQNVRDAIREHETDIGNMTFTGLSATDISAAIRELRTELGDHSTIDNASGYSATSASAGIVEIQGALGNYNNLTTAATNLTLAINELDLKQGAATLGTDATTLSGAINELETAARGTQANYTLGTGAQNFRDAINELEAAVRGTLSNYTLTTSANNLVGAINEHETQINTLDTNHLNKNLAGGVNQNITGSITFTGDSVDFSNTTALFSSAGGVANFGSAFVNLNATAASGSNVNIQGLQVDRTALSGSNPKHDVRLIWNETLVGSKPARAWQLRGMANDKSDNTADIVTFYNAEDLIQNNSESGIAVTWDSTNQNFDFNVADPTLTFTSSTFRSSGNLGSATITNLGNTTFALTADKLDLGYSEKILLGNSDEFQLYNDNTNSVISSTDPLKIVNPSFFVNNAANNETMISAAENGAVNLFYNNAKKIETTAGGVLVQGELESSTLDVNGAADISGNTTIGGSLSVNGNTTLGNASSDTVSVPGNLTITGDLTVNGTNTILNTATLEVEDTLILTSTSGSEPSTGGFGIETRLFSGTSVHANAASNVTGTHSFVYNFAQDRWEADGNMILDTVNSIIIPQVKINSGTAIDMTAARDLNLIEGTGIDISGGLSGTNINFTFANTDRGSSQYIFKNIAANSGGTAVANSNNDTLTISGGTALASARSGDTITINHSAVGVGAAHYGPASEDGGYIRRINVNAQGHVTSVTTDDFDDRYVQEDETAQGAVTTNKVVRTNNDGTITATGFSGPLSGNVVGNVTGNITGSAGSATGNAGSATQVYVTEDNDDNTFRRVVWHTGDGSGNKSLHHDDGLTYRSSDNTLSTSRFLGALDGNAGTSSRVYVTGASNDTSYRMVFGEANDGVNDYESLFKDTGAHFYYNPNTNTLTTGTFSGALAGNATTATTASYANGLYITAENGGNGAWSNNYPLAWFNAGGNAYRSAYEDDNLTYNPHTNTLNAPNLAGNASSASQVYVSADSDNASRFPTFIGTNANANKAVRYDANFTYNPHTNTLTAGTFSGSLSGNASSASSVYVTGTSLNTSYRMVFGETNDGYNAPESLYKDTAAHFYYNPHTNTLTVPNLAGNASTATSAGSITSQANSATITCTSANTGSRIVQRDGNGDFSARIITATLSGNASSASTIAASQNQTNSTAYNILFTDYHLSGTQNKQVYFDAGLYYNPGTNTLGDVNFNFKGSLNGNASTATSASTASSASVASTVTINYNNNSASTYQMLWGSGNSVYGTAGVYVNPSTNTIYATGDIIAAASDDRLKDKKGNIENALDKVNALNGFHYNWNDKAVELGFKTEEQKEEEHIGLSAQDVQKVAPELVTESSVEGYDTVRYDKVTALLVEAVKELTEQNKELKAEIESLKSINS